MSKLLSADLRERAVASIDRGLSRCKAAERFGVSTPSAIRWRARVRRTSDVRPLRVAAKRIVAYALGILEAVEKSLTSPWPNPGSSLPSQGSRRRSRVFGASSLGERSS